MQAMLFYEVILKESLSKKLLKVTLCSPIISVPVSIFFNRILHLYSQMVGLLKI